MLIRPNPRLGSQFKLVLDMMVQIHNQRHNYRIGIRILDSSDSCRLFGGLSCGEDKVNPRLLAQYGGSVYRRGAYDRRGKCTVNILPMSTLADTRQPHPIAVGAKGLLQSPWGREAQEKVNLGAGGDTRQRRYNLFLASYRRNRHSDTQPNTHIRRLVFSFKRRSSWKHLEN